MYAKITHIDDIRAVVEATEDFYIADKGDYLVANYSSIMAQFPPLAEGPHAAILRECRGMIFCGKSGNLIRRPLHKFFNYGQTVEYHEDIMATKTLVAVYDKLDGSMCAPFTLDGQIRWGSKMGLTHIAPDMEAFVARNPQYQDFAASCLESGCTPIFEYMAPQHRIVVDNGVESMVLLTLRHIETGIYMPHDDVVTVASAYQIPVVRRWEIDPNKDLVDQVRELEGAEGVVAEYSDGTRVKIKSLWYMDLHKRRDAIASERYVAGLVLNDRIDDAIGLVPDHIRGPLENYARKFMEAYSVALGGIFGELFAAFNECETKKDFALRPGMSETARWIGFKMWDGGNANNIVCDDLFKQVLLKRCDGSETDFNKKVREEIFKGALPAWDIWTNVATGED